MLRLISILTLTIIVVLCIWFIGCGQKTTEHNLETKKFPNKDNALIAGELHGRIVREALLSTSMIELINQRENDENQISEEELNKILSIIDSSAANNNLQTDPTINNISVSLLFNKVNDSYQLNNSLEIKENALNIVNESKDKDQERQYIHDIVLKAINNFYDSIENRTEIHVALDTLVADMETLYETPFSEETISIAEQLIGITYDTVNHYDDYATLYGRVKRDIPDEVGGAAACDILGGLIGGIIGGVSTGGVGIIPGGGLGASVASTTFVATLWLIQKF